MNKPVEVFAPLCQWRISYCRFPPSLFFIIISNETNEVNNLDPFPFARTNIMRVKRHKYGPFMSMKNHFLPFPPKVFFPHPIKSNYMIFRQTVPRQEPRLRIISRVGLFVTSIQPSTVEDFNYPKRAYIAWGSELAAVWKSSVARLVVQFLYFSVRRVRNRLYVKVTASVNALTLREYSPYWWLGSWVWWFIKGRLLKALKPHVETRLE